MHRHFALGSLLLCGLVLFAAPSARSLEDPKHETARAALTVLKANCYRCHGEDGANEGGMDYVQDLARLVARKKVTPGDLRKSPLFQRVSKGKMPPAEVLERPSEKDIAALRAWIEAGAPVAAATARPVTEADLYAWMLADLEKLEPRSRRFARYFSLAPQRNSGAAAPELTLSRQALSKLLNSLSWHYRITEPASAVDAGVLLRIDLRDFQWDASVWNRLLAEYPYGVLHDSVAARAVHVATGTRLPVIRADWFIATASRAPLYYDLLQMPTTAAELERQLRVDAQLNLQQERVVRAGFNGSGISKQNRLLERHDALHGAYWRTYDFDPIPQNLVERELLLPDRRNLFAYPLGPGLTENSFRHAGGELIFNLPNGLQAYMLVNADGLRINKASTAIVSDPKRPDRAVEAGVSCMGCHATGILPKADQIRDHVNKNPQYFKRADADLLLALHPPEAKLKKLMDEDAERFAKAIEKTGGRVDKVEPISYHTLLYERDVDALQAAAELGVEPDGFLAALKRSEPLARHLGALQSVGGMVSRQAFIQAFADALRDLRLGTPLQPFAGNVNVPDVRGDLDPLESLAGIANAAVFTPDGRLALIASADRSVIVWEIERNIELRRLVGHTASVWSVAVSPDGKRVLSGGADQSVRLWDITTGRELLKLDGHTGLVSAVAFSPDGRAAASAGYDGALILWNLETGQETGRVRSGLSYPNAIGFRASGLAVTNGRSVLLLDSQLKPAAASFTGHTSAVTSLGFSADGRWIVTGSDDRTARLWDAATGSEMRQFYGHDGYVKAVAFSTDGKRIATGGSDRIVRMFDAETGKETRRFKPLADTVVSVSFAGPERVLAVARNGTVKTWGAAPSPTPPIIQLPTAEYVRPTKDGFTREAEFFVDENEAGRSIRSVTYRGTIRLTVRAEYGRGEHLTTAEVVADDGKAKQAATAEVADANVKVKRADGATHEFPLVRGMIVTSAPDWTDTFELCRRYDRKKAGKQEFPGLWIHPTQPARNPTFTIEHQGTDRIEHLGKTIELERCLIQLRPGSQYIAWVDDQGRMIRLTPLPWQAGGQNDLVLKGYEKSAAGLRPSARQGP